MKISYGTDGVASIEGSVRGVVGQLPLAPDRTERRDNFRWVDIRTALTTFSAARPGQSQVAQPYPLFSYRLI